MSKTRARSYGRRSNNPFSTATFPIKGLSQFDWSHTNSYSADFGDLRPIESFDLILGTRMRCNLAYVLNMDPLKKPLYAGINVTFDAVYVSDMLLGYDSEDFFNPANHLKVGVPATQTQQPTMQVCDLYGLEYLSCMSYVTFSSEGVVQSIRSYNRRTPRPIYNTLIDALDYPFSSQSWDALSGITFTTSVSGRYNLSDLLNPDFSLSNPTFGNGSDIIWGDLTISGITSYYGDPSVAVPDRSNFRIYANNSSYLLHKIQSQKVCSFWRYFFLTMFPGVYWTASGGVSGNSDATTVINAAVNSSNLTEFYSSIYSVFGLGNYDADAGEYTSANIDMDALFRAAGYSSYQEYIDVYKSYLYSRFFGLFNTDEVDMRPIFAYRTAYNDLYVNTNIWDCDEYRNETIDSFYDYVDLQTNASALYDYFGQTYRFGDLGFEKRWWSNDMFTSAVPADMSSASNAVEIPSTGLTVVSLRELNIEQMVQDKLVYAGERPTDTTFAFFGFESPELRYRFARHIGRIVDTPRVDNVLQNSESTENSPLATPAGYGYGSKSGRFFDYQMPWYGFVMILQSVMTEPVYRDSVDFMIYRKDYEDFIFPDYQEISDITVNNREICSDVDGVFGWQRSYYYMMRKNHKLRGTMRLSEKLDWNLSRDMRDGFALNSDFATPNSSDRLNRIFSDTADGINHFNFFVGLDIQVTEPLRRDIHYHL